MRAMRRARAAALSCALISHAACGAGTAAAPPPPLPAPAPGVVVGATALTTSLARVDWILGDWRHADGAGEEHWVAIAGAIYGVAFVGDRFEVMFIDDADGASDGPPDGKLRLIAMPGGATGVEVAHDRGATTDRDAAVFVNPTHDFPTSIRYARPGADRLQATVAGTGGGSQIAMQAMAITPSPEAEAADRVFAEDTAADGVDGWVRHFAPDGAIMRATRIEGRDAIGAAIGPVLDAGLLAWEPRWSRLAPGGRLAATVGAYTLEQGGKIAARGSYVSVWRRTADGPWQVIFDVGRPLNAQTRVATAP